MVQGFDETDIALLDALHLQPRLTFEELARVLDVSAVTAARRWRRLEADGKAWVSSAPGSQLGLCGALFEAECEPGQAQLVADELARLPHTFSVHITTGQHNVYALVGAADEGVLIDLMMNRLPSVRGIRGMTIARLIRLFSGMQWRLGGINATQAKAVNDEPGPTVRHQFDDFDHQLYLALQHDGRLGLRELAASVDRPVLTVRKRLDLLRRSRQMTFRTDFARPVAGWPTNVVLKLRVEDASAVPHVGSALVRWPEIRVCTDLVGGEANLFVTAQLHSLTALDELSARLSTEFIGVGVIDRRVLLLPVKSFTRVLGPDGCARDVIPVDFWAPAP